jgi:hypothetical protein
MERSGGIYTNFIANNYTLDSLTHPVMKEAKVAEQLGHILKGAKVYISQKIDMVWLFFSFLFFSFLYYYFFLSY